MDRMTPVSMDTDELTGGAMDVDDQTTTDTGAGATKDESMAEDPAANLEEDDTAEQPDANEEDSDDSGISATTCICGNVYPWQQPPVSYTVECDACRIFQHPTCMGFGDEPEPFNGPYYCHRCRPGMHKETIAALRNGEKIWDARKWRAVHTVPFRQFPSDDVRDVFEGPDFKCFGKKDRSAAWGWETGGGSNIDHGMSAGDKVDEK